MEKYYLTNLDRMFGNDKETLKTKTISTDSTLDFIDFICEYQCKKCNEEKCPK